MTKCALGKARDALMETPTPAAFNCPSCGALSQAETGEAGQIVCGECGYEFHKPIRVKPRVAASRTGPRERFVQRDVVLRRRLHGRAQVTPPTEPPLVQEGTPVPVPVPEGSRRREEVVLEDGTRKVTKRRKKKRPDNKHRLFFMAFWTLVVALAVIGVNDFIKRGHQTVVETEEEKEKRIVKAREVEAQTFLNKHLVECRQVLGGFFNASDTAGRAQYVSEPIRVTPRMASYYQENLAVRPAGALQLASRGLKIMGEEPGIETVWEVDDGRLIEVVFVREKGKWVIDWEEFVRYGTGPWHRFLDGLEKEGEFRVYMRRRQVLVEHESVIGVQFYPGVDDSRVRQRGESPRVVIRKDGKLGSRLQAHWARTVEAPGVGGTMFGERDPEGFSRVRVVLAWEEGEDGSGYLALREVISGAWWGDGHLSTLENVEVRGESSGDSGEGEESVPDVEAVQDGAKEEE